MIATINTKNIRKYLFFIIKKWKKQGLKFLLNFKYLIWKVFHPLQKYLQEFFYFFELIFKKLSTLTPKKLQKTKKKKILMNKSKAFFLLTLLHNFQSPPRELKIDFTTRTSKTFLTVNLFLKLWHFSLHCKTIMSKRERGDWEWICM